MARKVRHSSLETRTARLKLAVRRKPYSGPSLARGVALLYRRNKTNGSWVLKASDGHGKYWTKAIAEAKIKTDKVDAEVLAQLLRCDFLPRVWEPPVATQTLRRVTARRAALVMDKTAIKNRIHAVLHQRLIPCPFAGGAIQVMLASKRQFAIRCID